MKQPYITYKKVNYDEKYGGDVACAEIFKDNVIVGMVYYNSYTKDIRGVDIRSAKKKNNDENAYYYTDKKLPFDKQVDDAIINIIFIIGKTDE